MKLSINKALVSGLVIVATLASSLVIAVSPVAAANPSSLSLVQTGSVADGGTFSVTLNASTTVQSAGGQAYITFNAAALKCNSVSYNKTTPFFGAGEFDVAATIDNTAGKVNGITSTNGGSPNLPVTGSGTWVTLNFTALAGGADSVTNISLVSGTSALADPSANWLPTDLTNASVTIGTPPLPDLTVSNLVATGVTGALNTYNVSFTVNNAGNLAAGAFDTTLSVNSTVVGTFHSTGIAATSSANFSTSAPITISGTNDNLLVTADSAHTIVESNENNNTATTSYQYIAPSGKTTDVNGDIVGTLTFTQPTTINFGHLKLGANNVDNSMTVLSNQGWTVNVHGNAPTTASGIDGKMTKYTNGTYDATVKLHNILHVIATNGYLTAPVEDSVTAPANYNVGLIGTDQLLANGITEGQNADGTSGETRTVSFNQAVIGSDAALTSPAIYHIVASFTAATTSY